MLFLFDGSVSELRLNNLWSIFIDKLCLQYKTHKAQERPQGLMTVSELTMQVGCKEIDNLGIIATKSATQLTLNPGLHFARFCPWF